MAVLLSYSSHTAKPPQAPNFAPQYSFFSYKRRILCCASNLKREFIIGAVSLCIASPLTLRTPFASSAPDPSPPNSFLSGIVNTTSWFKFFGDGFAIRVPPLFENTMEPEDYNAGMSFYGDKAKPKTFAARFASTDGSEVVSVIIKPSNQLKITFLEAQDITDLGSLKDAARIFVPGGSTLYTARTIKIKEDEGFRTYYFYEFGRDKQRVALVAAINSGKTFVAGASAPESKWDDDGVKLRSAAISLTVL
ncbi:hypothetical protein Dimus_021734 [Dionaea muscipula]